MTKVGIFQTPEHKCGYLDDELATTLFVDPSLKVDIDMYSRLTLNGFRRSGAYYYRPECRHCSACISVRVPVMQHSPSKSEKRLLKRHHDSIFILRDLAFHDEHYQLYDNYIRTKHSDGDMFPPSIEQYTSFIMGSCASTNLVEFRREDKLYAVAIIDEVNDGISAIYTFYDGDYDHISPGRFAILWQIAYTRAIGKQYLYLGYWIANCRKMCYKANIRPLEQYVNNEWIPLST